MPDVDIRSYLSRLNKARFVRFIHELCSVGRAASLLPEVDEGAFRREYSPGFHSVSLFHHVPLELFSSRPSLADPHITRTLEKLSALYKSGFPTPRLSGLGIYTNLPRILGEGPDAIVEAYEDLAEQVGIRARVGFADPDQIMAKRPDKASSIAAHLLADQVPDGLAITLDQEPEIRLFNYERFMQSGALQASVSPCEPIFTTRQPESNPLVQEFQEILSTSPAESTIEKFLASHYQEVFGFKYDRIETQLWLRFPELDISGSSRRLDIFLRNSVERDWEIFEIKRMVKLVSHYRDVPVLSHEIYSAMEQLKNYARIMSDSSVRAKLAREGIEYFQPSLRLVVGRRPSLPLDQWRWLKVSNEHRVKLITYDDLMDEMKIRLQFRPPLSDRYCK